MTRKLKEAVLAIKVEQELSKEEILERYLNTVYMGRGAYGIGAASRVYFGHTVAQADLPEAAYLAGLLRSPEAGDAVRDPEEATRRRETVLRAMVEEDYISEAEYDAANAEPWTVATLDDGTDGTILPRRENNQYGSVRLRQYQTEYYADYVLQQLKEKGYTDQQIYAGGLRGVHQPRPTGPAGGVVGGVLHPRPARRPDGGPGGRRQPGFRPGHDRRPRLRGQPGQPGRSDRWAAAAAGARVRR